MFSRAVLGHDAAESEPAANQEETNHEIVLDETDDPARDLQSNAVKQQKAEFGHWGHIPDRYSTWMNHSNRLIPVYTFGLTLGALRDEGSAYADPKRLQQLYGRVPEGTVNPTAMYFDQTDIYRLQMAAVDAGCRNIILMLFDGMDWQTTRAAALYKTGRVAYQRGRGTGLSFQDDRRTQTDFGLVCTSPLLSGAKTDVNAQTVISAESQSTGGYDVVRGGREPWNEQSGRDYLLGLDRERQHSVTDSAASATSMTCGVKTYNEAICVTRDGEQLMPIARRLQEERGFLVGVVTTVPVSHASVAAAYCQQCDAERLSGHLPRFAWVAVFGAPYAPLAGGGCFDWGRWEKAKESDKVQGDNFTSGNPYLHQDRFAASRHQQWRTLRRRSADKRQLGARVVAESCPPSGGRRSTSDRILWRQYRSPAGFRQPMANTIRRSMPKALRIQSGRPV